MPTNQPASTPESGFNPVLGIAADAGLNSNALGKFTDFVLGRKSKPSRLKNLVWGLISLALAGILLWKAFPAVLGSSWAEIFQLLTKVSPLVVLVGGCIGVAAAFLMALQTHAGFRGLKFSAALQAQTLFNALKVLLPFGSAAALAVIYPFYRRRGLSRTEIALGVVVTSLVPTMIEFLLPILGLIALSLASSQAISATWLTLIWAVILVGAAIFLTLFTIFSSAKRSRSLAENIANAAALIQGAGTETNSSRLSQLPDQVLVVRQAILSYFQQGRSSLLLGAFFWSLSQFALLILCAFATGLELSPLQFVAVFALGTTVALVPLTPGGVGLRETGMAALLVFFGANATQVGACLTLFALFTTGLDILLGMISAGFLRFSSPGGAAR